MRGRPDLATLGCRDARRRGGRLRRLRAHPRRARGGRRPLDRVEIVPPGVDVDEFRPEPREEALAALVEEARADPPNPDDGDERLPDEGNADALRALLRRRAADGRLLREADREQGRPRPARGARRPRRARGRRGLRRLPRATRGARSARHALHRARSSTATSATCCRSATSPRCRRSSPRRSGWSLPRRPRPACCRSSRALGPRRGRGGHRRGGRAGAPRSSPSRREMRPRCASASPRSSRCPPSARRDLGVAARRAVERAGAGRWWPRVCSTLQSRK